VDREGNDQRNENISFPIKLFAYFSPIEQQKIGQMLATQQEKHNKMQKTDN
jgi:hypothetical protein